MRFTYSALFTMGAFTFEWEHETPDRLSNQQVASRFLNYLAARGLNLERVQDVIICDDQHWPIIGCSSAAMLSAELSNLHPFPTEQASIQ